MINRATSKGRVALIFFLTLCLFFSLTSSAFTQPADIQGHWAEKQISNWIGKGLVKGYQDGTFKPDNNINRAEFISLVNRAFGFTTSIEINFSDVTTNDWFAGDISRAKAAGYISGYEDGTIRPNDEITRQEVAIVLAKILKLDTSAYIDATSQFKDAGDIPPWSKGSIGAVVTRGFMCGYPDKTYKPAEPITRAEAIVTLDRVIAASVKTIAYDKAATYGPATDIETIDGNVSISVAGVTLQNTKITGNLVLEEGIGGGDVTLKNVTVLGNTVIKGGGAHSVALENCSLPGITVSKEGVRIVASGNTSVQMVRLETGATLVQMSATGPGFKTVTVSEVVPANANITLNGNFNDVNIAAEKVKVEVTGGTVTTLEVAKSATGSTIDLASDAKVGTLSLDAAIAVNGKGTIETAVISISGATIEPKPTNLQKPDNVSVTVGTTPSGGGSGGGNGDASLNYQGAFLTTLNGNSSSTGASIEDSSSVPVNPVIKITFDRGVVRDYWDNNQTCFSIQDILGASIAISVSRIPDVDAEKHNIFLTPSSNLTPGKAYKIIISPNLKANNGNTLGVQKVITFTVASINGGDGGDNTAPTFTSGYPTVTNINQTLLDLLVKTNENGMAYYVVLRTGDPAPSATQVKSGLAANSLPAIKSGSVSLTADTEAATNISGLTAGTSYDIYLAAEDTVPNLQTIPVKVNVTTTTATDQSIASVALAVAGNKIAGAPFDLIITGSKDTSGTDLAGAIALTVTSDKDGQVYSGIETFTAGATTVTIPAGKVTTAGTNTLTVAITGVTPQPTVAVSVITGTQYDATHSTATISPSLAKGAISTVTVTLRDQYNNPLANMTKNLKIVAAVTNNNAATAESYTVDSQPVTATTTLSISPTTDANGGITFNVVLPATIDSGDGISILVTKNDGTPIGSGFTYSEPVEQSTATASLIVAGNKTAGASFDISITGAKNAAGADLAGSVAVTVTSDKDGQAFSGSVNFTAGVATVTIVGGKVTTAGTNTLTVAITGVSPQPTVAVTVVAGTQYDPAHSSAAVSPALAKSTTSTVTVTLRDTYNNPIANSSKSIKMVVTVRNSSATTGESYMVDSQTVTANSTLSKTAVTDASGQITFGITLPAAIDSGDGISVQVKKNDLTADIGSACAYQEP